mgnify:CR=1 FL=1
MKRNILTALAAGAISLTSHTQANPVDTGVTVAVVYNSSNKDSEGVARHYAARRIIPKKNLIGLPLPEEVKGKWKDGDSVGFKIDTVSKHVWIYKNDVQLGLAFTLSCDFVRPYANPFSAGLVVRIEAADYR